MKVNSSDSGSEISYVISKLMVLSRSKLTCIFFYDINNRSSLIFFKKKSISLIQKSYAKPKELKKASVLGIN